MQHSSDLFKEKPVEEYLLYLKRFWKNFSIKVVGNESSYEIKGNCFWSGVMNLSLTITGLVPPVRINLAPDPGASLYRKMVGGAPLLGEIKSQDLVVGDVHCEDTHDEDSPVLKINYKSIRVEAYKTDLRLVASPVVVFGIPCCEMVLEDYSLLTTSSEKTSKTFLLNVTLLGRAGLFPLFRNFLKIT